MGLEGYFRGTCVIEGSAFNESGTELACLVAVNDGPFLDILELRHS